MTFAVYDALSVGVVVLNRWGRIVYWNRQLEQWSGIKQAQAEAKTWSELDPKAAEAELARALDDLFTHGRAFVYDQAHAWFSAAFPLRLSAQAYHAKGVDYAVLCFAQATPAPAALVAEDSALAAILDILDALLFINDYDGRYVQIYDTEMSRGLPLPISAYVGKRLHELFPPQTADFFLGHIRRVIDEQQALVVECPVLLGDRERWLHARLAPYGGDKALGLLRDVTDRKRAEQAQQEEHQFALQVMQALGQGVTVASDSGYEFANPAFCAMVGLPLADIIGRPMFDFIAPTEHLTVYTILHKMQKSARETFETRLLRADGGQVDVLMTLSHHWREGARYGLISVVTDLSELKAAQRRIAESEAQLRSIMEAIPDVVVVLDKDGRYIDLPSHITPMYRPREELIGKTVSEVWDADIAQRTMAMLRHVLETGEAAHFEYSLMINGREHWFLAYIAPRDGGQTVVAVIRTITTLKEAVQRLAQSEAELKALFAAMTDHIFIVDGEGQLLRILETGASVTFSAFLRPGGKIHQILERTIADEALRLIRHTLASREPSHLEFSLLFEGRIYWYYAQAVALDDLRVLVVARDVTDRVIAQQKVLELTVEQEKGRLLAEFVHSASHDFRTPLSTINTSIYILSKSDKPEARERQIQVLRNQVHHLERLVDGLFTMSRLEMVAALRFMPVRISDILQYIEMNIGPLVVEKGLELTIDSAPNLPSVRGDEGELMRALRCLIDNAITFTPTGGIHLQALQQGEEVHIRVRDTGVGIAAEDLPYIFDRFFKADRARTSPSGLGVGLTIAKRIVELHRGVIEVESRLGEGSIFTVRLPALS